MKQIRAMHKSMKMIMNNPRFWIERLKKAPSQFAQMAPSGATTTTTASALHFNRKCEEMDQAISIGLKGKPC